VDFTEARDSELQWHQLGYMQVCTSHQTDSHTSTPPLSFFILRVPFLPPNQQRPSTEGTLIECNENNPDNANISSAFYISCQCDTARISCQAPAVQQLIDISRLPGPQQQIQCSDVLRLNDGTMIDNKQGFIHILLT